MEEVMVGWVLMTQGPNHHDLSSSMPLLLLTPRFPDFFVTFRILSPWRIRRLTKNRESSVVLETGIIGGWHFFPLPANNPVS